MSIANITFIKIKDICLAIDSFYEKVFQIDNLSFNVLTDLKRGRSIANIEDLYGSDLVNNVIERWNNSHKYTITRDRSQSDISLLSFLESQEKELIEGVFLVSQNCNMKCRYCYGSGGEFGNKGFMSKEMATSFFRLFLDTGKHLSLQKVRFLGGEPLLNFEIIKYIISLWEKWKVYYPQKTILFSITTNGTLLSDDIAEYLASKRISITISLDGPEHIHNHNRIFKNGKGTFASIMRGMQILKNHDVDFAVRCTFTSDNNIKEIFNYFETTNHTACHILPADFPCESPQKDFQLDLGAFKQYLHLENKVLIQGYLDIKEKDQNTFSAKQLLSAFDSIRLHKKYYPFRCGAGWWIVAFSSDGYIYPCHRLTGNPYFRIGDLKKGINYSLLKSIYIKLFENSIKCKKCWAFPFCKRRCLAERMQEPLSINEMSEKLCELYRNRFAQILYMYVKSKR